MNVTQANATVEQLFLSSLEKTMYSLLTTVSCCCFLYINGVMLYTLRSKQMFRETSRYILLYNLLMADTLQLALGQFLYLLATFRLMLTYYVCGFLTMLSSLTSEISPLTLVVMSLERYVAVCFPFRHTILVTVQSTSVAVAVVWTFTSLNVLIRIAMMLTFPFQKLESLQMKDFCAKVVMFLVPISSQYDEAYTCIVFIVAGLTIIFSYIGVIVAAKSVSADKASVTKALNTVLLHMIQLGLSLFSTMYSSLMIALMKDFDRLAMVRFQNVLYICIFIFPRCLSALIYGLRDQTLRPILMYHFCCWLKFSFRTKVDGSR